MSRFLIVGLGNPGPSYEGTRHNVGFALLDQFAVKHQLEFRKKLKFDGLVAEGNVAGSEVFLLKPLTYMNLSGRSVSAVARYFDIPMSRILIVVDDIDLDFGVIRLKINSGPGTHNGLKSVEKELGSHRYARLKIGVGNDFQGDLTDHVLGHFTKPEQEGLSEILKRSVQAIEIWLDLGITRAMDFANRVNPSNPSNGD